MEQATYRHFDLVAIGAAEDKLEEGHRAHIEASGYLGAQARMKLAFGKAAHLAVVAEINHCTELDDVLLGAAAAAEDFIWYVATSFAEDEAEQLRIALWLIAKLAQFTVGEETKKVERAYSISPTQAGHS
jgi:hypothetical protein